MEDNVDYSTLVFSTSHPPVLKDGAETENVVYSEIRTVKEKTPQRTVMADEVTAPGFTAYRQATAALGLLCVLLLAGLTAMCVLNIKQISKYTTILGIYTNESTACRILQADKAELDTEKEELTVQRDQYKNTLGLIIQFSNFPITEYCTLTNGEVYCEPCMKNWIQNGSSCYLFNIINPWLTWTNSQKYCDERGGHLAVIDTPEKQEFISQKTPFYYDKYHGYWIGLSKQNSMWIWTTGAKLQSNGFWSAPPESQDLCVLSKPSSANLNNWEANKCYMYNRYICEMKAMVWPSQM